MNKEDALSSETELITPSGRDLHDAPVPIVEAIELTKLYNVAGRDGSRRRQILRAVDRVSLEVQPSETVGLIGESGSGKSTLGRGILRLLPIDGGSVRFEGQDISQLTGEPLRKLRRRMNLIFQNPHSAVDRRRRLHEIIQEPLDAFGISDSSQRKRRVLELLDMVQLPRTMLQRYPHELSGGQLQRAVIARAIATQPDFLVADEPTASLDMSVRAQITNLLIDLKAEFDLAVLFISHDLRTISHVSDRIAVMYLGRVVEVGPAGDVEHAPLHPYTITLIAALPLLGEQGEAPAAAEDEDPLTVLTAGEGCRYAFRCPAVTDLCRIKVPDLEEKQAGRFVACHHVDVAS
jgi:oligopeptide/dipeptide ABC transporter ATP-binding protein